MVYHGADATKAIAEFLLEYAAVSGRGDVGRKLRTTADEIAFGWILDNTGEGQELSISAVIVDGAPVLQAERRHLAR